MKILFVGGIHGDERTGLRICEMNGCTLSNPYVEKEINGHTVAFLIANPMACYNNVRYITQDINTIFGKEMTDPHNYELVRQHELIEKYGKASGKYADVVIDLHSTESNTNLLMFPSKEIPSSLVALANDLDVMSYYVPSDLGGTYCDQYLGNIGLTLEISCDQHRDFEPSISLVDKFVKTVPEVITNRVKFSGKGLVEVRDVMYPKQPDGSFQLFPVCVPPVKDLVEIHEGTPLLKNYLTGEVLEVCDGAYIPAFVNLSSYYAIGVAMELCKSVHFTFK